MRIDHNYIGGIQILLKDIDLKQLFLDDEDFPPETKTDRKIISKSEPKSTASDRDIDLDLERKNLDVHEESEWIFTKEEGTSVSREDIETELEESFSDEEIVLDRKEISESTSDDIADKYKEQQERYELQRKELRLDFDGWKKKEAEQLERLNVHLLKKQDLLLNLEEKNTKLELALKSKLDECENQAKDLREERDRLKQYEEELTEKERECNKRSNECEDRLLKINKRSKMLDAQRAKFMEEQKDFALQTKHFDVMIKDKVKNELNKEFEGTQEELETEWDRLHREEEKLSEIYQDMLKAKDKFQHEVQTRYEQIDNVRSELSKEWEKVKTLRKKLESERAELGSQIIIDQFTQSKVLNNHNKKNIEDRMLAEMEDRLRSEITEQLAKENETSKAELKNEWAKLRSEQKKLAKVQDEVLHNRRNKSKKNFESKVSKLKKLFKKNKVKQAELAALESEFRSKEEKRLFELAEEEERKRELEDMAHSLEDQRKELDNEREELLDEWNYISKVREKIMEENKKKKSEQKDKITSDITEESEIEKNIDHEFDNELNKELEELQMELKKEWNELRTQHDLLAEARKKISHAKSIFEKEQEVKNKKFDKVPISQLGLDKLL